MATSYMLRIGKLKGAGSVLMASRHNKRTALEQPANIDQSRSHLNYCLMGACTPQEVAGEAKLRMSDAGVAKHRTNGVAALEIIVSLPVNSRIDHRAYFADCLSWIAEHFNVPVLSFDVHLDEGAPHAHAILLPLVAGKMNGSDLMGGLSELAKLHASFHASVAGKYGLKKAQRKLTGAAKDQLERKVLAAMKSDPAMQSQAWPVIRDRIHADPEQFAECYGLRRIIKPDTRSFAEIMTQPVDSL